MFNVTKVLLVEKMKILAIGDIADNIFTLRKFTKRSHIHLITFPRKQNALLTNSEDGIEFFDSLLISRQVERIKNIKDNYDLCLAMSWAGARIAYLAGLNYIMYFVGADIATPPFAKNPHLPYLRESVYHLNFIERNFYKKVFQTARVCVGGQIEYNYLKKYRKDAIRLDKVAVDITLFNENVKPIELTKRKFIFLSAQRFGLEKGFDVIWDALKLCKTDFEVLQVNWFIEDTEEDKQINKKLLENIPPQVRFIPLIKRSELARYFVFADAILGQMRIGCQGAIEREAVFCRRPVLCYTDPNMSMYIDNKKIVPPYLPHTKKPTDLAELMDRIVESKEFRDNLAEQEFQYVKKLSNPEEVILEWENIFEKTIQKYRTVNRKTFPLKMKIENIIANLLEKLVYSKTMRDKNIKVWGKSEYERLTAH